MTEYITDDNFDDKVKDGDCLVVFGSPWAGPAMFVTEDYLGGVTAADLTIYKMDVDANYQTPIQYNIRQLPLFLHMNNGKPVKMLAGIPPVETLNDWLKLPSEKP